MKSNSGEFVGQKKSMINSFFFTDTENASIISKPLKLVNSPANQAAP